MYDSLLWAEHCTGLVGHLELQLLDVRPEHIARLTCEGEVCSQGRPGALDVYCLVPRAGVEGGRVDPNGGGGTQETQEGEGFRQDCHGKDEMVEEGEDSARTFECRGHFILLLESHMEPTCRFNLP